MFECPPELSYSHHHLWVRYAESDASAVIGITEDLVDQVDEIVSVDLPMIGDELEMDHMCVHLHLQAGIRHLYSPLTGRATAINRDVLDEPSLLHVAPYEHWLYRMEFDEPEEVDLLMNAPQYLHYIDQL